MMPDEVRFGLDSASRDAPRKGGMFFGAEIGGRALLGRVNVADVSECDGIVMLLRAFLWLLVFAKDAF
jgi:hypothetical protein